MTYSLSCAAGALVITGQAARRGASSFCAINTTALWFPVAPGTTSLPAAPAEVVNPTPAAANQVSLPPDWNDDAPDLCYLFQDILPVDVPPVFPVELTVSYVLPPFLETVEVVGIVKTKLVVSDLPYALALPSESVVAVTRTALTVLDYSMTADAGSLAVDGQAVDMRRGWAMTAGTGALVITGQDAGMVPTPTAMITAAAGTLAITGQDAGFTYGIDPNWDNTWVMLHFDGTSGSTFFENQAQNNTLTAEVYGSAAIATDFKKWGTGSGRFSFPTSGAGYTGHAVAFDDLALAPGTGDFTIECWVYLPTDDPVRGETIAQVPTGTAGQGRLRVSTGSAELIWTASSVELTHQTALTFDTWHHIWMVRQSGTVKIAIDGVQSSSTVTDSANYSYTSGAASRKFVIGNYTTGSTYGFGGRIDDLRYTVTVARALEVPTGPYPNQ